MNTSKNKKVVELHGCIVCAKLFNILVVYTPEGKLLDCTVTAGTGHSVQDEQRPLVTCDTHTEDEIKFANQRWQFTKSKASNDEQEDE